MDRRHALAISLGALTSGARIAQADNGDEIPALYARFLAAQNARDLEAVRRTLLEAPTFLWISDGRPFWGPDALIARMGAFQRAEIWHVEPDLSRARIVEISPTSAFLFQPLALTLGPKAGPNTIHFLVNVLCAKTDAGWRIAALFTTEENRT